MAAAPAADTLPALNHTVQQHTRVLNSQLNQALAATNSASPAASISVAANELRHLTSCNIQLAKALAKAAAAAPDQISSESDETKELRAACYQRHRLLQDLLQTLDDSVISLRAQLDACHKLLRVPPCQEDAEAILRYAHTLRHGFAPLGSAPGLLQVPPAPQLPFMLHSTLRLYNMDLATQQQQHAVQQPAVQQPPMAPGAQLLPDQQQQQPLAGAAEAAAATAAAAAAGSKQLPDEAVPVAAPVQLQPIIDFRLNTDMDEDLDLGETASEEESEEEEEETSVTED